jgi:PKHD-type hydroxylase
LRLRCDLLLEWSPSPPEFFRGPGGELIIHTSTIGPHRVKLPAGHLLLYPATFVHRVEPVRRGMRLASFFWVQSLVRGNEQRALLWDLQLAIGALPKTHQGGLLRIHHTLLRRWAVI